MVTIENSPSPEQKEKKQDNKEKQQAAPAQVETAVFLTKPDIQALENKYADFKKNPTLKADLQYIAAPKTAGGLGLDFFRATILSDKANIPPVALQALAQELRTLAGEEQTMKQMVLSPQEILELSALLQDANQNDQAQIHDFMQAEQNEYTTTAEVMFKTPEQERLMDGFTQKIQHEIEGKYPGLKTNPDVSHNLSLSVLDWYTQRVNKKIATSPQQENKIQQNILLNTPLFALKDAVLNNDEQSKLTAVLARINTALTSNAEKQTTAKSDMDFATFDAKDFHAMLNACTANADPKAYSKPTPEVLAKDVVLGKELDTFIDNFTKAPQGNQTVEAIAQVSKQVFDKLSSVGSNMATYIENNFGMFENIFAIPLIGPFLKGIFVGEPGKEADRYKSAKGIFEKKLSTLTPSEQIAHTAISEQYALMDKNTPDEPANSILGKTLNAQSWFRSLVPPTTLTQLTPAQQISKDTTDALRHFDATVYLKTIMDKDMLGKITKDAKHIATPDASNTTDVSQHMLQTMYSRLGNDATNAVDFATKRLAESPKGDPSEQLQKDFATYANSRLEQLVVQNKTAFTGPMDVVNLLTFDLLKNEESALLIKTRPSIAPTPPVVPPVAPVPPVATSPEKK